jgi:hypothetical protein
MRSRVIALNLAVALGIAALTIPAISASATAQAKPRAGAFSGTETGPGDGSTITFVVPKSRATVRKLTGNAEVKVGCKGPYSGYEAPTGPMVVTKSGSFTASTTQYPGPKLRVTVIGKFTSPTAASGRIIVRFKRLKGCNAVAPFTATRGA